jgi:hypothetical protein
LILKSERKHFLKEKRKKKKATISAEGRQATPKAEAV